MLRNGATLPANLPGPTDTSNTPRAQITDFDTTKRKTVQRRLQPHVPGRRLAHDEGRRRLSARLNDVESALSRRLRLDLLGAVDGLAGQTPDRGTYGYYEVNNRGTIGKAGADIISLYMQDQWQIGDRLTLNLGIRAEDENVPTFRPEIQENAIEFAFGDKLAPRLGLQLRRVRATAAPSCMAARAATTTGRSTSCARGSFGGDIWCINYRAIDDPNEPLTANFDNMPGPRLWGRRAAAAIAASRTRSRTSIRTCKPMSQDSNSAGFDFEVNPRTVATVHYVHNNLNRTIEDLGALVDGNEEYIIGNPGEGIGAITPARLRR